MKKQKKSFWIRRLSIGTCFLFMFLLMMTTVLVLANGDTATFLPVEESSISSWLEPVSSSLSPGTESNLGWQDSSLLPSSSEYVETQSDPVEEPAASSELQNAEPPGASLGKDKEEQSRAHMIDVPYLSQEYGYPSGCEVVSATMLLQYYGYPITVDQFIDDYLEKQDFYRKDGVLYGADPNRAFAGDPWDKWSCGCYAPVIKRSFDRILWSGHKAVNTTGTPLEDLKEYIDRDIPVLFWASIDMQPTGKGDRWTSVLDGTLIQWISQEHCMVLVGYDEENYYFNDPYQSKGLVGYEKSLVQKRFLDLCEQSVVILPS